LGSDLVEEVFEAYEALLEQYPWTPEIEQVARDLGGAAKRLDRARYVKLRRHSEIPGVNRGGSGVAAGVKRPPYSAEEKARRVERKRKQRAAGAAWYLRELECRREQKRTYRPDRLRAAALDVAAAARVNGWSDEQLAEAIVGRFNLRRCSR
jgi:hypothetical protein